MLHALEQLLAPFLLAVARVLHFDPVTRRFLCGLVGGILSLADDAFQVHGNDLVKQQPAVTFNVVEIEDAGTPSSEQFLRRSRRE